MQKILFLVVGPGIILMLVSGILMLFSRPSQLPLFAVVLGLLFFAVIVISIALFQAPQHAILINGFDREAYEFLLKTNWIRTAAWSAYALLVLWMVWKTA